MFVSNKIKSSKITWFFGGSDGSKLDSTYEKENYLARPFDWKSTLNKVLLRSQNVHVFESGGDQMKKDSVPSRDMEVLRLPCLHFCNKEVLRMIGNSINNVHENMVSS